MSTIEKTIDVAVPVSTAYNQWTQFESFPRFMSGVDEIQQLTESRTHWRTSIGGVHREFDAEIVEQQPDQRIAWRSVDGPRQAGLVSFQPLGDEQTRVTLQMRFEPDGFVENAGDKLGLVDKRVDGDLHRFKDFIEGRGEETGAWRGEINDPATPTQATYGDTAQAAGTTGTPDGEFSSPGYAGQPQADYDQTRVGYGSAPADPQASYGTDPQAGYGMDPQAGTPTPQGTVYGQPTRSGQQTQAYGDPGYGRTEPAFGEAPRTGAHRDPADDDPRQAGYQDPRGGV